MIVIFDTETTGLLAPRAAGVEHQPYLVELSAIVLNAKLEKLVERSWRVRPPVSIPKEATKVHGITDDDVKDCPVFIQVYKEIVKCFYGMFYIVGHNVLFDKYVLYWELWRWDKLTNFPWAPNAIDTAEVSQQFAGYRMNLTDLHQRLFNETFSDAHSAAVDTRITCKCFLELVNRGMIRL